MALTLKVVSFFVIVSFSLKFENSFQCLLQSIFFPSDKWRSENRVLVEFWRERDLLILEVSLLP